MSNVKREQRYRGVKFPREAIEEAYNVFHRSVGGECKSTVRFRMITDEQEILEFDNEDEFYVEYEKGLRGVELSYQYYCGEETYTFTLAYFDLFTSVSVVLPIWEDVIKVFAVFDKYSRPIIIPSAGSIRSLPPFPPLRLDAAVPDKVIVGRIFDLAVAVRQLSSPVLSEDDLQKVRSGNIQVDWPKGRSYIPIRVQISAPDCEIQGEDNYSFRLYRRKDSPVHYFHLIPKIKGEISIIVTVYQKDYWSGSTRIHTKAYPQRVGEVQLVIMSREINCETTSPDPLISVSKAASKRRTSRNYIHQSIRTLLAEGFTEDELRRFCFDVSEFRAVYDQLTMDTSKAEIIDRVIEHADRKLQFEPLLDWAKEHSPVRYKKYQPYKR